MVKTRNDEIYEAGVKAGLEGNFGRDIAQDIQIKSLMTDYDVLFDKGYTYGENHRQTKNESSRQSTSDDSEDSSSPITFSSSSSAGSSEGSGLLGGLIALILIGAGSLGIFSDIQKGNHKENKVSQVYETRDEKYKTRHPTKWHKLIRSPSFNLVEVGKASFKEYGSLPIVDKGENPAEIVFYSNSTGRIDLDQDYLTLYQNYILNHKDNTFDPDNPLVVGRVKSGHLGMPLSRMNEQGDFEFLIWYPDRVSVYKILEDKK